MLAKAFFVGFIALLAAVEFGEARSAVLLSVRELLRRAGAISHSSPTYDVIKKATMPRIVMAASRQLCLLCWRSGFALAAAATVQLPA